MRVSIAREGGAPLNSKRDGSSSAKKNPSTIDKANDEQVEKNGKDVVFSAKKRTSMSEQASRGQTEMERARLTGVERRKSASKTSIVGKQGIGSFGVRAELPKSNGLANTSTADKLRTNASSKSTTDRVKTRNLTMVLKSEQRFCEKNEKYCLQLKQLQDESERKDQEMERLRSASQKLQNLVSSQSEEIRELRVRLKETFNENSELRDTYEMMERELRRTREALIMSKMQQEPTSSFETQMVSLTSHLYSMAIAPPLMQSCIEEGQEESEEQIDGEGQDIADEERASERQDDCTNQSDFDRQGDTRHSATASGLITTNKVLPEVSSDESTLYTMQDLHELVLEEEDLLKERCANALKELNLPLTPLLTSEGALDVVSLKAALKSISSKEDYLTADRISSIRRLTEWIGSSREDI